MYVIILFPFCRKVAVYSSLDGTLTSMLALLGNEESANSLRTSDFNKVKLMRRQRMDNFQGHFTPDFQQCMFMLFNALVSTFTHMGHNVRKCTFGHFLSIRKTMIL